MHSRINRTQTFSSFSTYRYLFLWILWQCIWCVNLTNGNSAASHTDTLTHRERKKFTFIKFYLLMLSLWIELLFSLFFFWFLIDWFLCVDSCIRESERMKDYSSVIRKTESDETMRKTFRFRITFAFQLLTNGK